MARSVFWGSYCPLDPETVALWHAVHDHLIST